MVEKHPSIVENIKAKYPQFLKHLGEAYDELPGGEFMEGLGRSTAQDDYDAKFDNTTGQRRANL